MTAYSERKEREKGNRKEYERTFGRKEFKIKME
jgi:hypothetical protein